MNGAEELQSIGNHLETMSLLPRLLVLPGFHLETSFHKDAAALLQILGRILRRPPPDGDFYKRGFFLAFPVLRVPDPIEREPQIRDRRTGFGFTKFGLAGEISDKGDAIVTVHVSIITDKCSLEQVFFELCITGSVTPIFPAEQLRGAWVGTRISGFANHPAFTVG